MPGMNESDMRCGIGVPSRIAALILAAGCSRRMNGASKLLAEVGGLPMVQRAVNTARALSLEVVVVTGHEAGAVCAQVAASDVRLVHNPDYTSGMASSLRRGVAALPPEIDGVLVMLADMPCLRPEHLARLMAAFTETGGVVVPFYQARRGNPVLWPRRYFVRLQTLEGDEGARSLLQSHAAEVVRVEMEDDAVLVDVDTPDALAACQAGFLQ